MQFVFTDRQDVGNPSGKLQFGANSLERVDRAKGLPSIRVRCVVRQPDQSFLVYGLTGPRTRHGILPSAHRRRHPLRAGRASLRHRGGRLVSRVRHGLRREGEPPHRLPLEAGQGGHALWHTAVTTAAQRGSRSPTSRSTTTTMHSA